MHLTNLSNEFYMNSFKYLFLYSEQFTDNKEKEKFLWIAMILYIQNEHGI